MALTGIGANNYDAWQLRNAGLDSTRNAQNKNGGVETTYSEFLEEAAAPNLDELEAEFAETESAAGVNQAGAAEATTAVGTGEESAKIKEEIQELEEKKQENIEKMEKIEAEIEDLAEAAEANIMEALAKQEAAAEEHEEESKAALDENIKAYVEANKEGGEGMTREELQANIKNSLPNAPQLADSMALLVEANEQISEIDSCLGELNKLILDTQAIDAEIEAKEGEYEAAVAAEEAAKCCDPIGFTTTDKDGNQAQYDFIVDDGAFDSTSDFLGANGQWNEMAALDTDGDNIVSSAELQAGNIKAVKTNADGSQEIVDLAQEFGEDFSIDLSSYSQGGSHSAIDTVSDDDGDGVANQTLLGTFNLNINGETVNGYNTLDDNDWLSENYGISANTDAETTDSLNYSEDLLPHVNFFNTYTQKVQELKESLQEAYAALGVSESDMAELDSTIKKEADVKAQNFFSSLEVKEDDNQEEAIGETDADGLTEEEKELLLEEDFSQAA